MRTLSLVEVEQVSGAGTTTDVTRALGNIGTPNQNCTNKPDPLGPTCKPPEPVPDKVICWFLDPEFNRRLKVILDSWHN